MAERRAEETTSLREVAEEDPVAHRVEDLRQAARAAEGTARVARPQAPGGAVAADEEDGAAGEDEDVVDEAVVAEEDGRRGVSSKRSFGFFGNEAVSRLEFSLDSMECLAQVVRGVHGARR